MYDVKQKMNPGFRCLQGGLFSAVSKADVGNVADEMQKRGVDMLSWADPFMPDAVMPEHVRQKALEQIQEGKAVHYTTPIGNSELKAAIAEKLRRFNGFQVDPERNILITPGSDSGLLFAMMPFLCPGDEVLVPDPSYPSNFLNPQLLGARAVSVPLLESENFALDLEAFREKATPRTKMVLLTNPNNPTGTVFTRSQLTALAEFIVERDLILVVDQAFEDSVFDGREMVSMASLPGMWERTVSVFSVSKGMGLSGLRVGYLVAEDRIMDVLFGCAVNVIGATNTAFQAAAVEAFRNPDFIQEYNEIFDRRRKRVFELLSGIPGVRLSLPESAFLTWIDVSALGTAPEVAAYLLEHAKVFVNDGTPYGTLGAGHLRIVHGCFRDDQRVYAAVERIRHALLELGRKKGISH